MWGGSDDAQSIATIRCAVERGIYLIDTAPVYGFGHSDGVVGRALEGLREAGKIRTIGVSNFSPEQMDTFRRAASLAMVQPPYNIFERAIERDVLPYAKREKLVVLAYGALCRGLLSGRMTGNATFDGDDLRKSDPKFQPPRFGQYRATVNALKALA